MGRRTEGGAPQLGGKVRVQVKGRVMGVCGRRGGEVSRGAVVVGDVVGAGGWGVEGFGGEGEGLGELVGGGVEEEGLVVLRELGDVAGGGMAEEDEDGAVGFEGEGEGGAGVGRCGVEEGGGGFAGDGVEEFGLFVGDAEGYGGL